MNIELFLATDLDLVRTLDGTSQEPSERCNQRCKQREDNAVQLERDSVNGLPLNAELNTFND